MVASRPPRSPSRPDGVRSRRVRERGPAWTVVSWPSNQLVAVDPSPVEPPIFGDVGITFTVVTGSRRRGGSGLAPSSEEGLGS
jgi:hypothetical protein